MKAPITDLELNEIIASGPELEPIPGWTELEGAISPIMYPEDYATAMSYLRALMARVEYSERSLALTLYIIRRNPAHYTVWTFRYHVLRHLTRSPLHSEQEEEGTTERKSKGEGGRMEMELGYIERMARESSKNYQLWHHREQIIKTLYRTDRVERDAWTHEKAFLSEMVQEDAKNYHVWSYRTWLVTTFPSFREGEVPFTRDLIHADPFNNSAWNHRFLLLFDLDPSHKKEGEEGLDETQMDWFMKERNHVMATIDRNPDNVSAWSYLSGMYRHFNAVLPIDLVTQIEYFQDSIPALGVLLASYEKARNFEKAKVTLERVKVLDPIRVKYWTYRATLLNTLASSSSSSSSS